MNVHAPSRGGEKSSLTLLVFFLLVLLPCPCAQDDCDRDFFMTPEEALDYGLIDQVVSTKTSHIAKPLMPSLEEAL